MRDTPLGYFITFTTYGTWLHGDKRSSVIRQDGKSKIIESSAGLQYLEQKRLKYKPVILKSEQRHIVRDTIVEICDFRQWDLFALHVRSNHVHVVLQAKKDIALVINDLKQWATRRLHESGFSAEQVWTRGGSRKYIFREEKLYEKVHYIIYEQGLPMAYYIDKRFRKGDA